MKRKSVISVVVSCFVFMVIMTSCVPPVNNNLGWGDSNGEQDAGAPNPDLARVVIPLPTATNPMARGVELGSARYYTNYFEVTFRRIDIQPNAFHTTSASAAAGEIVVEIPAGTYDILLLAGYSSGVRNMLLASSYVLGREIVLGSVNQIQMQLAIFDVNIIAPNNVNVNEPFTVSVEMYTKNPMIGQGSWHLQGSWYSGWVASAGFSNGHYIAGEWFANTPNLWTSSASITAPMVPTGASFRIEIFVHLFNYWGANISSISWMMPETLAPYFTRSINFIYGQTMPEVEIEITWPDN